MKPRRLVFTHEQEHDRPCDACGRTRLCKMVRDPDYLVGGVRMPAPPRWVCASCRLPTEAA